MQRKPPYRVLLTISELTFSSQVRNLVDLVSQLDPALFTCEIGALRAGDAAAAVVEALGVPKFRFRLIPTRNMNVHDYLSLARSPLQLALGGYDLVHSLLYQSVASEVLAVRALTRAKYVYTKSNLEWDNHPGQWRLKSRLSDRIVSISEATSDLLRAQGFGDRVAKIHLGIDTDTFRDSPALRHAARARWRLAHDTVVFGNVAQFVEWKEHLTLLRAFELVADERTEARLVICGPNHRDAYYQSCVDYLANSRHRDRVQLLGSLSDMPEFYSAIDVFVLPSRFETFGYSYVEAMSCRRPAIGCRAAGPLEIITPGGTGALCEMSNPGDLAAHMRAYAVSDDRRRAHGAAARARVVELFSKEAMARRTTEMYLELLTGAAAPSGSRSAARQHRGLEPAAAGLGGARAGAVRRDEGAKESLGLG